MCIDENINRYQIPVFCINEPLSYTAVKIDDKNLST